MSRSGWLRPLRKLQWWLIYRGARRDVTVDTWNGRITFDSRDRLIGKRLWVDRAYERDYIERAVSLLRKLGLLRGGLFIDVGANIGMVGIALLKQELFDRALAFEPAPNNVRLLERNVADNGLAGRVHVYPCALSSAPGVLELELATQNSGDNRIRRTNATGEYGEERRRTVRVEATTLVQALATSHIDADDIALIWVDIQGHEAEFLLGARDAIRARVPVVAEVWPYGILRAGTSRERYMQIVSELFTTAWLLDEDPVRRIDIAALDACFDSHAGSRQFREVLFLRE
jgi:FkbM family methyltransferase